MKITLTKQGDRELYTPDTEEITMSTESNDFDEIVELFKRFLVAVGYSYDLVFEKEEDQDEI